MGIESPRVNSTASGNVVATAITADDLEIDSGTLSVDATNNRVGIGTVTPDCPLDVNASNDLPQAIMRYGSSYKTDLLTTSNGTFRITPTARTFQVDTGDTNGGNIQFTKAGGTISGAISWDTGDKDVTLYSDANLYLGAGGSAADLTLNSNGAAEFGADGTGLDVRIFSETASEGVLYDASQDELGLLLTTKLKFHDIGGGEEIFASADGHLEVNAGTTLDMTAPTVDINASTAVTIDGPDVTISSSTSTKPVLTIQNNTNDANPATIKLVKDRGAAGASDDKIGDIAFFGEDAGQNSTEFARIRAHNAEAGAGSEGGELKLQVATHNGTMKSGLKLKDGNASNEIDVTIGSTTTSLTTVEGTMLVEGGQVTVGGSAPKLTIGDNGAEDTMLVFDGNAQEFRIGIDDGTDTLEIGVGQTHGTTATMILDPAQNIDIFGMLTIDTAIGDEKCSGITAAFEAGEALNRGDVVYYKASDSKMHKVNMTAGNSEAIPAVAMAAEDISINSIGKFLMQGVIHDAGTFPTYTVAGRLYSPEAEGPPTQTKPSTDGDLVQVIGWAITADKIYFNPSPDYIEVA